LNESLLGVSRGRFIKALPPHPSVLLHHQGTNATGTKRTKLPKATKQAFPINFNNTQHQKEVAPGRLIIPCQVPTAHAEETPGSQVVLCPNQLA
jgi:hypothetical protein